MDLRGYSDEVVQFYRGNHRTWHIISSGQEIEKKSLSHQEIVERCNLTPCEFDHIMRETVEGFRLRQSNDKLLLASLQLILIWDSRACYVIYDNVSSQRFHDFINTAKAWVSDGIPFDNSLLIRAALNLIYTDIQDQVRQLKFDVEDSWCTKWALRDLGEKGSRLSSECKKVMDDIFNPRCRVGEVQVVNYLGPNELLECKNLWASIEMQLDGIRSLLNTKLRRLKTRLVSFVVLYAVCVLGANVITAVRLVVDETRSSSSVFLLVSAFCICFVAIFLQLSDIPDHVRERWLSSGSAIKED